MSYFQMRPLVWASLCVSLAACGGGGGGSDESNAVSKTPTTPASFSISGTIHIPSGTFIDLDTADPGSASAQNDTEEEAQPILNPSVLGGYVSARAGYYVGNDSWWYPQDPQDYFKVRLLKGQSVRLEVHDADGEAAESLGRRANADGLTPATRLTLIREEDRQAVATRQLDSLTASVTAPEDGQYYILVSESRGPTSYILSVGQASAQTAGLSPADEFVPGEVIVAWDPMPVTHNSRSVASAWTPVIGSPETGQLLRLNLPVMGQSARSAASVDPAVLLAEQKRATLEAIAELRSQPGVRFAEPNYIRRAMKVPNDPIYGKQWHYPLINLPTAWDRADGQGTVVAVLDSGVLLDHPDLKEQFVDGFDFISRSDISLDGDGLDPDPTDPGSSLTGASNYHGTHVAGTVAAITNNGIGVAGVAPGAKVMPLRVLGKDGKGSDADIAEAVKYAAGLENASGRIPDRPADVINMSLGSGAVGVALQNAIREARAKGVIIVASAGNSGSSVPSYPAAFPEVVSVSAVSRDKTRASYSNFGPTIDLAAPGGGTVSGVRYSVASTWGDDRNGKPARPDYAYMEGTSMAAPHVAGVVALMKSARQQAGQSALTPAMFDQFLAAGYLTQNLGNADYYGAGLIDAAKAVSTAVNGAPDPVLAGFPSRLVFDLNTQSLVLMLENGGGGELFLDPQEAVSVVEGAEWISVRPIAEEDTANGPWRYQVSVDRSGLRSGVTYTGRLEIASSANTLEIPVLLEIPDPRRDANAGRHYLMLIDPTKPAGQDVVQQLALEASNGTYRFSFSGVEPGSYHLLAGTDLDNDGLICDGAEACAVYPVLNAPAAIDLTNRNISGLSFFTGFTGRVTAESISGSLQNPGAVSVRPRLVQ